jgi:hypothetical protein
MIVNRGRAGEGTRVRVAELVMPTLQAPGLKPDVSVIVPVTERPEPLAELFLEYSEPLADAGLRYEFVFVVEPRNRQRVVPLRKLAERGQAIRVFEVGHTVGESVLLMLGAARSRADTLIVLPAYRRVDASALPELYVKIFEGADLVNCRRNPRRDSWLNRMQTRVLHTLVAGLSSGRVRDVGSGVRAMRREVLSEIPLYGDFFRFLPVLAIREGYQVEEIDAPQHASDAKTRVHSPGIYLRRLIDVFGLFFLARFTYKPLRFFGMIGGTLVVFGGLVLVVLFLQRLAGEPLAGRPLLLLGVLVFTLGVQAIALGLIGEIIVHFNAPRRSPYRVQADTAAEEPLTAVSDPAVVPTADATRAQIGSPAERTAEG